MSLFRRKNKVSRKQDKLQEAETSEVKVEKKSNKKSEGKNEGKFLTRINKITQDIVIKPWITEKSHAQITENKYVFQVHQDADKKKIKAAIEAMYKVNVKSVNIVNIPPKKRNYGRYQGKKSGFKKALIGLEEGEKIELFKGV